MEKRLFFTFFFFPFFIIAQPTVQWRKAIKQNVQSINKAVAICIDKYNNCFVTGLCHEVDSQKRILVVKYDVNGAEQWRRVFRPEGGYDAVPVAMSVDESGEVVLCGTIKNKSANTDILTIKYSADGVFLWLNIFSGKANLFDAPTAICTDKKNNVFVAGYETASESNPDLLLIRYSPSGETSWMKNFSTSQMDIAVGVDVDDSCNVYVCGNTNVATRSADIIIMKFDSLGVPRWNYIYDGVEHAVDIATDLLLDDSSFVFVTGSVNRSNDRSDVALLKLNRKGKFICEQLIGEGVTDATSDRLIVSKKSLLVHAVLTDYLQQTTSNFVYYADKSCRSKYKFNAANQDVTYLEAKEWSNNSTLLFGTQLVRPENTLSPYIEMRDSLRKNQFEFRDTLLNSLIRIKDIIMTGRDIYFLGDDVTVAAGTISLAKYSIPEEPKKKSKTPTQIKK